MTNLNLYRVFIEVAKAKNISKASEKLFISQPAVSFSLRELEKQLNQKLFIRKPKGVELTTFGNILFDKIVDSIDELENAEILADKYSSIEMGVLRIGANTSNVNQLLFDYLTIFAQKYPNIQITMNRGQADELIKKLNNNELDVIFVDNSKLAENFEVLKNYKVKYQLIGNSNFKVKYPSENITPDRFPVEDLILPSENNNSRITINNYFSENNVKLNPKYELDNYILLYDFVKKGFGIAFVNIDYYKNEVEKKEVEVIYPQFSIFAREIVCLTNKHSYNNALSKFAEIVKNN